MLELTDVVKRFGSREALAGLTLSVEPGEAFGLLGPNGAGKTTTIRMACGLLAPDSGRVEFEGFGPPTSAEVRRVLGVAPQSLAIYDELTCAENLEFFGRLFGMSRSARRERAYAIMERVQLEGRARDKVATFSGGMKRRLNLAAALMHEPRIVFLDEPTAGVDPHSRHAILELVRELQGEGVTIVYTTHYMEEAQRVCDRVAVMDQGCLLALGTVDELIAAHGGETVVTVERGTVHERVVTAEPMGVLSEATRDTSVTSLRVERPDLEAVFLSLTGRSLRD